MKYSRRIHPSGQLLCNGGYCLGKKGAKADLDRYISATMPGGEKLVLKDRCVSITCFRETMIHFVILD